VRLWSATHAGLRALAGEGPDDRPPPEPADGSPGFRWGRSWFAPVPQVDGYWMELDQAEGTAAPWAGQLISHLLGSERDSLQLVQQLHERLEEIELLYTISETLGRTLGLADSARTIVREVAQVVGARRASILVHDPELDALRPVAGWGVEVQRFEPVAVTDPDSVAARVFREGRVLEFDPTAGGAKPAGDPTRTYRGAAFISVPILYPQPEGPPRAIGVLSVTDRVGADAFSPGNRRLLAAVASQVGASIENQRLVERDREQQRLRREVELARNLQMKLLKPRYAGHADVAVRCQQAEEVGGDFYHIIRLPEHRLGVMLGDVSSHGFPAALVMALVLSAAGIHAEEAGSPEDVLRLLLASVGDDLRETEMFLTLFYAVTDRQQGVLRYANAGHPHAWVIRADGTAERLAASAPPLALGPEKQFTGSHTGWARGADTLVLCSDGVIDAVGPRGRRFGEQLVLDLVRQHRAQGSAAAVRAVFAALEEFNSGELDDRTVLVLNA
jgi:sigma-B regulation protein RsbU (phosphoserine phosphatase)